MKVFIDRDGNFNLAKPPRVSSARIEDIDAAQYANYLIVNLGFVEIATTPNGAKLRWRPRLVTDVTFVTALYFLTDNEPTRVLIEQHDDTAWSTSILGTPMDEILSFLATQLQSNRGTKDYIVQTQSLELPSLARTDALYDLHNFWRNTNDGSSERALAAVREFARTQLKGRYVWMRRRSGRPLCIDQVGPGFPDHIRQILHPAIGRSIDEIPDYWFSRYCFDEYTHVAIDNKPSLQNVDAYIHPPDGPSIRRRYRRLILPFKGLGGSTILLGASTEDRLIDLRRGAA